MTAHFQFFMILGAAILLLIIFALLKKGQMSVKYSLLWLALAHGGALGGVHAGQCQQVVCQGSGITGRGT